MNKKNRIYLAVLAALIVIFFLSRIEDNKEKRFNFFAADSNSVARFEITSPDDTLHLALNDADWKMVSPVVWDLQEGKIDKIMRSVLTAEASTIPVSENKSSLKKYALTDSVATHFVTIDKDGKVLDDVLVGKSSNHNVTPVRKSGSDEVFLLESNIGYMIKPNPASWRKREIVDIDPEQITKFMVVSDEATYTLTLVDSLWEYSDEKETFSVKEDNANLKALKNAFKRFAATDFVDGEFSRYEQPLAEPVMQLGIELWEGESYYFRYAEYEDKKYVVQVNSDQETLYVQYESNMKKFQKKAEDFK